jgi:hypothetical protein
MNRHRKLKVLARFQPRVVDDLMPELAKVIGAETVFTYTRQMDEDVYAQSTENASESSR